MQIKTKDGKIMRCRAWIVRNYTLVPIVFQNGNPAELTPIPVENLQVISNHRVPEKCTKKDDICDWIQSVVNK